MRPRRQPGPPATRRPAGEYRGLRDRDRGSFTVELAVGLPALLLMLFAGLSAVAAVTTQARCIDAAREGALHQARGGQGAEAAARIAPPGATIDVGAGAPGVADTVTVTVRAAVPLIGAALPDVTVSAQAVAAREPGAAS